MDLEEVWRIREDEIYPRLFGPAAEGIYTLPGSLFTATFGRKSVDPFWLFHGVMKFPPRAERAHWIYATSGYSNPWAQEPTEYDPAGESGAGVEFLFQASEDGAWAVHLLQYLLAYELLVANGLYPGGSVLRPGSRVSLKSPINGEPDCVVRHMVATEPEGMPPGFALPSGTVSFLAFTGATDAEIAFARKNSTAELIDALRSAGHHPVTDPRRASLL